MTNVELAHAVYDASQAITQAIHDGATPEELQFLQDAHRAYRVALLTLNGQASLIAETV